MIFGWLRRRRRKKFLEEPWPEAWSLHLNRNVRLSWELDEQEFEQLQNRIKVFCAEKYWEGADGLEVTEEMRVSIAAQACLMLLGVEDFYFDNVKTVIVFSRAFVRETVDGRIKGGFQHRSGEAWQGGPIVLSWSDALQGGRNEDDGRNVVIHEFAHALDGLDGEMGGNPMFDSHQTSKRWAQVVDREFTELNFAKETGRRTLLDHYGATNRAEFFAVSSETFFEQPRELGYEHPELYELLKQYYRVDPTRWQRLR